MTKDEIEKLAKESAKHYFKEVANTTRHRTDDGLYFREDYIPSITATWSVYDYAFKAGYLKGIEKAIEICELYMNPNNKFVAEIFDVKEALEQLLSSEGEK